MAQHEDRYSVEALETSGRVFWYIWDWSASEHGAPIGRPFLTQIRAQSECDKLNGKVAPEDEWKHNILSAVSSALSF